MIGFDLAQELAAETVADVTETVLRGEEQPVIHSRGTTAIGIIHYLGITHLVTCSGTRVGQTVTLDYKIQSGESILQRFDAQSAISTLREALEG